MDLPHTVCASNYTAYPGGILEYHHTCQTPGVLELEISQCWETQRQLLHCPCLRLVSMPTNSNAGSECSIPTLNPNVILA